MNQSNTYRLWKRFGLAALALFLGLGLSTAFGLGVGTIEDTGPRHHAQGQYDTVTATYVVVEGDDLIAIGERFQIPVDALKTHNKLASDEIETGQRLTIPGGSVGAIGSAAPQVTGKLGSPSATTTIPGNQLPAPAPKFGGVIKETVDGSKPS